MLCIFIWWFQICWVYKEIIHIGHSGAIEKLIEKLYQYQPFLSQINNSDNKLEGFNELLELNLSNNSSNVNSELELVFRVADRAEILSDG